jgi:hypothetical protein
MNDINANLYAEIIDGEVRGLIMPDAYGELTAAEPAGEGWHAVRWPVNPHFTGERTIDPPRAPSLDGATGRAAFGRLTLT